MNRFSIITPSFNQSNWLKLCIASVADQEGVELEHIVQDACSTDGTLDWLPFEKIRLFPEMDQGMYDAVNKGLQKAKGNIVSYLNCDEQYLPDTLKSVADFFDLYPDIDVAISDTLVVDGYGRFICFRKVVSPTKFHSMISNNLSFFTCSLFFRRTALLNKSLFFDRNWRDLGDAMWALNVLRKKVRIGVIRRFTATFTDTGANMNLSENAIREKANIYKSAPIWARKLRYLIIMHYWVRKLGHGCYSQRPFSYAIYTKSNSRQRTTFFVEKPTTLWKSRFPLRIF